MVCGEAGSKPAAAAWAKDSLGNPWQSLISEADQWRYGVVLNRKDEAIDFLRIVIDRVLKNQLALEMADEIRDIRNP